VADQDRTADVFSNNTESITLGYASINISLGWDFGSTVDLSNLRVTLEGNNLLDKRYQKHLTDGGILSPGRGIVARLEGSF
jgi:hemoglobin/transferrin/lactoferrin receptor protein